jgi:multidrug efflux pump subunit AcrB
MEKEIYNIEVEVRDENGKAILDDKGNKQLSVQFELSFTRDKAEHNLRQLVKSLKAWMPNNEINISASVFNEISGTYMNMFSLYVNEDRFVSH